MTRLRNAFTRLTAIAVAASTAAAMLGCSGSSSTNDPAVDVRLASWRTDLGGRYARVVETVTGSPVTTWPAVGLLDTSGGQPVPAYADAQRVRYSTDFVYVDTSGLASHQMGPWYWTVDTLFGNWSQAQGFVFKIPRTPTELAEDVRVASGLGPQGAWVNGVAFFNQLDGAYYNTAAAIETHDAPADDFGSAPDKIWVRDAIPVEGPTFDKSNAHQPPFGQYHYHSNPLALRFQLGDNVEWSAAKNQYVEITGTKKHSPILGWARDGYPIYGPYGYTDCSGSGSTVAAMRSGYVLRDGTNGTTNLSTAGRKSIGKWAAALHKLSAATVDAGGRVALAATNYGPGISTYFYLGRYNEDYEHLADLGKTPGTDFDLDQSNGRTCRTPEFPNGTYAYYITIAQDGSAPYPYTVGRQFHGSPSGGLQTDAITETVAEYGKSVAAGDVQTKVTQVTGGRRIEWSTAEGSTYKVEASTDGGASWGSVATDIAAASPSGDATPGGNGYYSMSALHGSIVDGQTYAVEPTYRVTATAVATYSNGPITAYKGRMTAVSPSAMTRGSTASLAVEINGYQPITDFDPLASIPPTAVELVTIDGATVVAAGTRCSRQLTRINCDMLVPGTAAAGTYMVRVMFGTPDMLQSSYQSVTQLLGVPAASIAPSPPYSYPDLPITVQ